MISELARRALGKPISKGAALRIDGPGGTEDVMAQSLQYGVREGGDGEAVCVDAEVLFQFLDEQSRSLRDFLRSAREG